MTASWKGYGRPGFTTADGIRTREFADLRAALGNPAGVRAINFDDLIATRQFKRNGVTPELEQALARIGANPDWR